MNTVYEVVYKDDFNVTHMVFLKSWNDILYVMQTYGRENVTFNKTEYYPRETAVFEY